MDVNINGMSNKWNKNSLAKKIKTIQSRYIDGQYMHV